MAECSEGSVSKGIHTVFSVCISMHALYDNTLIYHIEELPLRRLLVLSQFTYFQKSRNPFYMERQDMITGWKFYVHPFPLNRSMSSRSNFDTSETWTSSSCTLAQKPVMNFSFDSPMEDKLRVHRCYAVHNSSKESCSSILGGV